MKTMKEKTMPGRRKGNDMSTKPDRLIELSPVEMMVALEIVYALAPEVAEKAVNKALAYRDEQK